MKRLLLIAAMLSLNSFQALAINQQPDYVAPPQPTAPQIIQQHPGELHPILPIARGTYHRVGRLWYAIFGPRTW